MKSIPMQLRKLQQGAVALVVALVLVFGVTLIAFFANRGMIFEQRTSVNQYRYTRAFEMAEAGLEWAVARLNDDRFIDAACSTAGTGTRRFRDLYLAPTTTGSRPRFNVTSLAAGGRHAGCTIAANGTPACSCPAIGEPLSLGSDADARFSVRFNADPGGDPLTVEVVSFGCTNAGTPCDPGSTYSPDGTAVVRALFKVRPKVPSKPGAGLVAGSAATTGGSLRVINLDVESNGITINSGTTVVMGSGTDVVTLPGTPPHASVLDNDFSLKELTNADADGDLFFRSFFGQSMTDYRASPQTWLITGTSGACTGRERCTECGSDNACGQAVADAIDKGAVQFWADATISLNPNNRPLTTDGPLANDSRTFGTAANPLSFASSANVEIRGEIIAFGLFFVATGTAVDNGGLTGTGGAQLFGSFVTRGNFVKGGNGTLDVIYDPGIAVSGETTGLLVRVPGSWRDKESAY